VGVLELLADEGPRTAYEGTIGRELLALMAQRNGPVTERDLRAYEATWSEPVAQPFAETRVLTRAGLAPLGAVLAQLPPLRRASEAERALALARALDRPDEDGHTTNLAVVDADGNACVITTSLGLGAGEWLPGRDLHLNSMLGETDLIRGALEPGRRMESMMSPAVALDEDGLALAAGAAGGTRLRSALVQVLAGILDEGLPADEAVSRPRLHPTSGVVHLEPGFGDDVTATLQEQGLEVREWPDRHHYFGGVSVVTRSGAAGDPRRSGSASILPAR
jgi:gamma-glutamyltranspeptidase/glutathione hydrolase